ncbi:MAG: GTPase Era [bacterium]
MTAVRGFRSGFVVLAGRPNVGKSTLLNRLVGQKVAITASVPQTTRTRLQGIITRPNVQIVLVDTPGIHHPRHRLGEKMVSDARHALADADVVLFMMDASAGVTREDEAVAAVLKAVTKPIIVAMNKVDRLDSTALEAVEASVRTIGRFESVIPISASVGTNVDRLVEALVALLPEGPQYFPPEMYTDQPEQFLVRELIREQAIQLTREEIPHSVAVEIEEFAPRPGTDLTYIRATVHVERESHKKMLIGRDGRLLKEIGQRARREIEALLGRRVFLDLWVKTSKGWRDKDELIKSLYPE